MKVIQFQGRNFRTRMLLPGYLFHILSKKINALTPTQRIDKKKAPEHNRNPTTTTRTDFPCYTVNMCSASIKKNTMNNSSNYNMYLKTSWGILIILLLFSACQTLRTVNPSEPGHVEKMNASENELIWIYHLAAVLCETTYYTITEEAVSDLDSLEVRVYDSFQFDIPSCSSCGCPSGKRFAANIRRYDLNRAMGIGWHFLEDESVIEKYKR